MRTDAMPLQQKRLEWIDWMKAIGIYFIALGHFFSVGYEYVYVFNVPLFFLISGFLCKKEEDNHVFWKKIWFNLVIPLMLISLIIFLYKSALTLRNGSFELIDVFIFMGRATIGMNTGGVGVCWFVYTLILLKIIGQYCTNKGFLLCLCVIFLAGAYLYNHFDPSGYPPIVKESNAIVNVCTAYPFFAFGLCIRRYKKQLDAFGNQWTLGLLFIVGMLLVYVCGYYNGEVWMYLCGYGGHFFWFLLGGVAGSCSIFALSKLLGKAPKMVKVISKGTILILGFHIQIIFIIRRVIQVSYLDYLYALVIVLLFVPVIVAAERFFPLILGKCRLKVSGRKE